MKTFYKKANILMLMMVFTLLPAIVSAASFETNRPHSIKSNSAVLFGVISGTIDDGERIWFEYGNHTDGLNKNTASIKPSGILVNTTISGLVPESQYFYRSVIMKENGSTRNGKIVSFRTQKSYASLSNSGSNGAQGAKDAVDQGVQSVQQQTKSLGDFDFFASFFKKKTNEGEKKDAENQKKEYEEQLEKEREENKKLAQLLEQEKTRQAQIASRSSSSNSFRSGSASVSQAGSGFAKSNHSTGMNFGTLLLVAVMMFVVLGLIYLIIRKKKKYAYARPRVVRNHQDPYQNPQHQTPPQGYDPRYYQ